MNIITALNNETINEELKKQKEINIVSRDIPYREGILEILEKQQNVQAIIIYEGIYGQIKIEKLIQQIKNKNSKIIILIILNKKENLKEKYLIENKIKYLYLENLTAQKIIDTIFSRNKIIAVIGNEGSGKTVTTAILGEYLSKNKKVLIVEDNIKNNSLLNIYKKNIKKEELIIQIKNNLFIFSIKNLVENHKKNQTKIINEIKKIKDTFNYILIDTQNIGSLKLYNEIINENLLILNPNILEINKIKNLNLSNKNIKIILNYYNENAISEEIIKNLFKNNATILEKLEYSKSYNLMINHNFNINYLDAKIKRKIINIIKKI